MLRDTLMNWIQRLELTISGRESILIFKEEFEEYLHLIDTFKSDQSVANRVRKATSRECMKVDLIENLIMTDAFEGVATIEELSDDHLKTCTTQWRQRNLRISEIGSRRSSRSRNTFLTLSILKEVSNSMSLQ